MEELQFPIDFNECPCCGSRRRIAEIVTDEEKEKGTMADNDKVPLLASRALMFSPASTKVLVFKPKEVTALFSFLDVCADCGTVYAAHIEKGKAQVSLESPPSPRGNTPPGFGRG